MLIIESCVVYFVFFQESEELVCLDNSSPALFDIPQCGLTCCLLPASLIPFHPLAPLPNLLEADFPKVSVPIPLQQRGGSDPVVDRFTAAFGVFFKSCFSCTK